VDECKSVLSQSVNGQEAFVLFLNQPHFQASELQSYASGCEVVL